MAEVSKLFDNKQLVHIASEIVVLSGLTFYFSSKNKRLLAHIEELSQRIEEQEDRIQKFEVFFNQKFDSFVQQVNMGFNQVGQNLSLLTKEKKIETKHTTPIITEIAKPVKSEKKVNFYSDNIVEEERSNNIVKKDDIVEEELSDSDLDEEIRDELNELDTSLKKET